jgi:predicted 3-demethylubiquinone-9 3-methyltransferase (glyoxalase superfamily)
MQKITPFLWFEGNAEEAMNFYASVFKDSKVGKINRYENKERGPRGGFITGSFQLAGQEFMALSLNDAAPFKFNESISLFVNCESQEEVDYFWERLSDGGTTSQCGWLKDKFGLSWQIVPVILGQLLQAKDPVKAKQVMSALLGMTKIDIEQLRQAAA